jgi:hypothetical protein
MVELTNPAPSPSQVGKSWDGTSATPANPVCNLQNNRDWSINYTLRRHSSRRPEGRPLTDLSGEGVLPVAFSGGLGSSSVTDVAVGGRLGTTWWTRNFLRGVGVGIFDFRIIEYIKMEGPDSDS